MADATHIELGLFPGGPTAAVPPAFVNFALDASTDSIEWIFQAKEAITITHLGFRYGVRTGTPATYRISLQGVTTAGRADATIKGATNNALKTFTPPADATWNSTWQWHDLDEDATVARGDLLAIVIDYSSGTIDASNTSSITTSISSFDALALPFAYEVNGGVAGAPSGRYLVYGYKSSSKSYGAPVEAMNTTVFTANATPDEYALKFTLPAAWGDTYQVVGVRMWIQVPSTDTTNGYTFQLFDTDGTSVLQDITLQADVFGATSTNTRTAYIYFNEATLATLSFGSTYWLSIFSASTTVNTSTRTFAVDSAQELDPFPLGQNAHLTTRTNGGAWTNLTAERPLWNLILADWTEPSASSSMLRHPGMAGGLNA